MSVRQTPITYIGTSLASTNSTIVGLSTGIGGVLSSYSNVFTTSNLTVKSAFLMSNATPSTYQAQFFSTAVTISRGDLYLSNATENDGVVTTAPDGLFGLCNTYVAASNAGISIVNAPYDPNVDANAYSSNLNTFFLNTNVVVNNTDSGGTLCNALVYGGIGFGCNSPSYPIDMSIDPSYSPGTVYHGAAISLNGAGLRINSDQSGQITVASSGNQAEASFTSGAGPLMAFGSGTAARGGYIFASAGDAMNIAASGQVSICNAGVAQTAFSLYVGGNAAFNSSITMSNGDLNILNTRTQTATFMSTNVTVTNANFTLSNAASVTATANFYSTSVGIFGGNLIMSNSASVTATAAFYSTNMTIYNGSLTLQPPVAKTANFYSTSLDLYGNINIYGTVANRGDNTTYIADKSSTASAYATTATVNFSNFSGMIIINNVGLTGITALWLCGGGSAAQIGASGASGGTGTVFYNAGVTGYTWSNNTPSSQNITFALIRTRTEG